MTLDLGDATVVAVAAAILMLSALLLGLSAMVRATRLRRFEHLLGKLSWPFFVSWNVARKGNLDDKRTERFDL